MKQAPVVTFTDVIFFHPSKVGTVRKAVEDVSPLCFGGINYALKVLSASVLKEKSRQYSKSTCNKIIQSKKILACPCHK